MADTQESISLDKIYNVKSTRITIDYSISIGDETDVIARFYAKKSSDSTFNQYEEFDFTQDVDDASYTYEGLNYDTEYDFQLRLFDDDGNNLNDSATKSETTKEPATESLGAYDVDGKTVTLRARILDLGNADNINANFQYREVGASDWEDEYGPQIDSLEERDPDDNDNLSGWYDCSVVEDAYDGQGNLIKSVPDQDGSNNLWYSVDNFPDEDTYDGYDCLTFNGEDNIMTGEGKNVLGDSFTVITVVRATTGDQPNGVWQQRDGGKGPFGQIHSGTDGEGIFRMGINDEYFSSDADINTSDMYVCTWQKDFNVVKGWVDGKEEIDDSTTILEFDKYRFGIGSANQSGVWNMDGNIFYVVTYNRALNDRERQGVEKYLGEKFGISIEENADIIATPYTFEKTFDLPNETDKFEYRSYFYDRDEEISYISENVYPIPGQGFTQDLISEIDFEDNNDTYYYETMEVDEDYSQIKNKVMVFEEEQEFDEGAPIENQIGYAEDSTSIDDYGEREYVETASYDLDDDNQIQKRLQERAERILDKYKEPIKSITFETRESGLTGGMLVNIKSESRDLDGTFIIDEVEASLDRQNKFIYRVSASTYKRPGFDRFIKKI